MIDAAIATQQIQRSRYNASILPLYHECDALVKRFIDVEILNCCFDHAFLQGNQMSAV